MRGRPARIRTRQPAEAPSGVWRAEVTKVSAGRCWVIVPRLGGNQREYGPLEVAQGAWTAGGTTEPGGADNHVHGAGADLVAGNRVLVAFIEGRPNDLVVLARLP